jgi:hypothetical protein
MTHRDRFWDLSGRKQAAGDGQLEDVPDERGSADRVADLTKLEAVPLST